MTSASDVTVPDEALEVLGALWRIEHALRSRSKLMEARLGVTGPQRFVLRLVSRHPNLTPGDLARMVHLHPSTLTGVLQRLVDRGLLERRPDKRDHRRVHLRVRPAATHIIRTMKDTVESSVAAVIGELSPAALSNALHVLGALSDALGPIGSRALPAASRQFRADPPDGARRRIRQSRRGPRRP